MADHAHTDEYGYPLRSTTILRRRRSGRPVFTGAVQQAGYGQMPATVQQLAEQAESDNEREGDHAARPN